MFCGIHMLNVHQDIIEQRKIFFYYIKLLKTRSFNRRIYAMLLTCAQQSGGKCRLQQRFPAGKSDSAAGTLVVWNVFFDLVENLAPVSYTHLAMKSFREEGYIDVDHAGHITLTEKGMKIAEKMYERHEIIAKGLMALGVDEGTAYEDSCKIEHYISAQSFDRIKAHLIEHNIIDG